MESRVIPPAQASARQTELGDKFDRVLFLALDAIQERNIPYALIGGIAASGLGRPRSTHDIDIFVRPEDAEATLEALERNGFETERTDPRWLFKGWKDEMMVDIIFKSQGDIYFDDEMHRQARHIRYHGREIPAVSPEDLVIIKGAVHSEFGPHHWHDALAILSHATLDWGYLLKRSRRASRRLLALLIYAQSNDIWIPNNVIFELFHSLFGESQNRARLSFSSHAEQTSSRTESRENTVSLNSIPHKEAERQPDAYLLGHINDALATDTRTAALDAQLTVGGNKILVKGESPSQTQRRAIEDVIRDIAKGYEIDNQIRVTEMKPPEEVEEVV